MLIQFAVANYRSIKDEAVLSLVAGREGGIESAICTCPTCRAMCGRHPRASAKAVTRPD